MNRVFLTGTLRGKPEIAYSPKGQKIFSLPFLAEEGDLQIEVVVAGDWSFEGKDPGSRLLVVGTLARTSRGSRDGLRLKANKILWMEE